MTELSAVDVLYPGPGEVIRVESGEVLVFAQDPSGRRIPLGAVRTGEILIGCDESDGVRMLATGMGGTRVAMQHLADVGSDEIVDYVRHIGRDIAHGTWPARLLDVDDAASMVSPGEHIAPVGAEGVVWVQLTSGRARWCGAAEVTAGDPPLPLLPGAWLTAGLRCRVRRVDPPADEHDLGQSLDLVGRLALASVVERRQAVDAKAVDRLEARSLASDAAAVEAVETVTGAVGGAQKVPVLSDARHTAELGAAMVVAQASNLPVTDEAVLRAASEIEAGRDPISALAAASQARPRDLTLRSDWWQREGSAMFVWVSQPGSSKRNPAAAVWQRGGWVIVDPMTRNEQVVDAEVAALVDRRAWELLQVLPGEPLSLGALGRLALRGSRRELIIILGITALMAGMSFVTPYLLGQLANLFIAEATTEQFAALFIALLLTVVAATCFQAVRALSLLRARSKGSAVAAAALWERIIRQRATWHGKYTLGERATQANAVNNASASLPDESVSQMLDVSMVIGSLAAIATTNSTMLIVLAALLLVQAAITGLLLRITARRADTRFQAVSAATSRLLEIMGAVNRLRVAGAESRAFLRWAQVQAPYARADQDLRRVALWQGVVVAVWPLLSLVAIVWVTASTDAGFGEFVTAQTAASAATLAVSSMTIAATGALLARQAVVQAEPALESVPEGGLQGVSPGVISGGIEARDLVFRYAPDAPPALDHVSVSVAPGEHVAIVGPSGCGKTTLMRILLGLEDPDSGVIAVDGKDLASLNRPAVRRQIGSVLQSSSLLPVSIKDNIDMGRGLTPEQVWEALETADLAKDVKGLAMGIDTPVTDGGGTLSGGQRQRVLIARAMAGHPRMLVLDEATSALDNVTQEAVVESLERLRITRIVVAHRLSTIRHADRIIVMQAGRVIDEGTFDELVSRPGTFRDLVERQNA